MSSKRLYVSGLAKDTTEPELYIYFQSRKKSGGGDIESITSEGDSVVVTFEEEEVLNSVLSRNKHELKGSQLKVSRQPFDSRTHPPDDVRPKTSRKDMGCKIKVGGLSTKTTKDAVENYFENSRRSGGGDVQEVVISGTTACITFADSEVVKNVVSRDHTLDGEKLTVELIKMEEAPESEEKALSSSNESTSRVIEVSGLASQTTEDAVCNYFENKRRSGGGEVENVELQPGVGKALVTFLLPEDARCVVEKGSHRLDGSALTVTLQAPVKQLPIDPLKLLVKGLNEATTSDALFNYMELITGGEVCDTIFGDENNALVCFAEDSEPGFNRAIEKAKKKKLDGKNLTVEQVEVCHCVTVTGFPENTTEDTIMYYFENSKRSGGGDVCKVDFSRDEKCALVYFQDPAVVESVVSREHCINNFKVAVRRHYPFLGAKSEKESKSLPKSREVEYNQIVLKFVEDQCSNELELLLQKNKMIVERVPDEEKLLLKLEKENEINENDWERACNDVMLFLSQFGCKTVHVADEALATFEERAHEVTTQFVKKDLEVMPISPGNQIKVIGLREKVEKLAQKLEDIVSDIVELERFKASVVTNELKDISLPKLLLLIRCGLKEQLQDELHGLEIDVNPKNQVIFFKGPKDMIDKAQLAILQMLAKSKEETVELPRLIISVLETEDAQEYIYDSFEQQKLVATLLFESGKRNELTVAGINGTQARKAADAVKKLTAERSMRLEEEQAQLLETEKWGTFIRSLEKNNLAKISFDSKSRTLWFGGCCENVNARYNKVKDFLEKNTIVTEMIPLSAGQRKFLFKYLRDRVNEVQRGLKPQSVVIKETEDEESAIVISGTEDGVNEGVAQLSELITGILHIKVPIDKPGMRKYFLGHLGESALKLVENEHNCIVEIQSASLKEKPALSSVKEESDSTSSEKLFCSYVTPENKTISLYQGDITKHRVDVIVNAANTSLEHVGGVAKAIVDAGGREIQNDCRTYIDQQGELLVGDVFASGSYKLPCKKVIHAVGPRWNYASGSSSTPGKRTKEERYLSLAVYNSLEEAKKSSTIAFPAISTGVYGFPRELCAKVMLETILEYSEKNQFSSLKDIHIIDQDKATVKTFESEMRERFGKEAGFRESAMETKSKVILKGKKKAMDTSGSGAISSLPVASSDPYTIVTPQNVLITLCIGDLAQEEADALVNTTTTDMTLQSNPCAKALSAAAGPTLQQECTSKAPLNTGELCVTSGGKLKCKYVFHVNCGDEQSLCALLQKCFKEANKRKLKSIAIPAIGTGNLGFPRDRVAAISVDEAQSFILKTSPTSLQEIRLVVFGKDTATIQAFQAEFRSRNQTAAPQVDTNRGKRRRSRRVSSTSPLDEDDEELEEKTFYIAIPLGASRTGRRLEDSQFELKVGTLTVQVQKGDITSERVDAIATVSNVNLNIAQGGGVGAAILRVAGNSIQKECNSHGFQKPGSVVPTGAGNLNAKSVYHIVPTSFDHDGIKHLVLKCLRTADSNGISSISFPAIGTGNLGLTPKNSAKAMLAAMNKFSQDQTVSVKLIRVVVFQASMLQDFHDALQEFVKDSPSSGFRSSVSGFFKGFLGYPSGETLKPSLSIHDKVSLVVFAGNSKDLDDAVRSVNDTMAKNCTKKAIDHEAIEKLSEKRKREIMKLEMNSDVKIAIETRASRVVVQGQTSDLLEVCSAIYEIINKGVTEEHAKDYAELLCQSVQWYYAEKGKMEPYDKDINAEIEQAYIDKKPSVHFTMEKEDYKITFKDNQETHVKTGEITEVCRKDLSKAENELPDEWGPQPSDGTGKEKDVQLVQLDPKKNAAEYSKVSGAVLRTAGVNITKIERVQNPALYKSYAVKKQAMDKKTGSNEMQLFHGTAGSSVATINRAGFNRSYCGKNAVVHGKGVYFARDASYSARSTYSPPDSQGYRYMYLAKVLVGQYTTGNSKMITPPPKSSSDPTDTYDSTADAAGSGASIFVVFYDNQCYPEYLITFS